MKYVYIYLDPRVQGEWKYKELTFNFEPFYIGVGIKKRMLVHLYPSMLKQQTRKSSKIKSILKDNLKPIILKVYENCTDEEAFKIEKDIISHFGRIDLNTGILCNHTDGGVGWNITREIKPRVRKYYYKYSLEGFFIEKISYNALKLQGLFPANISTSIKRKGTFNGFQWRKEYEGENISPTIKFKQKQGFSIIEKELVKNLYLKGLSIENIVEKLNSTNSKIIRELKQQGVYVKVKQTKKIAQYTLNDDLIMIWDKAFTIQNDLGYSSSTILACCKNKRKTYKKYKWKFYE